MTKESDILKIVKEDILEVVGRKNKRTPLKFMKLEVTVSHSFVSKAIKELEEEGLIKISSEKRPWKEYIQLTKEGQVRANAIIKKHSVLEKYFFKERRSEEEAIEATNILEHYISTEVIDTIKKLSTFKKEGIPLTEFKQEEGLIANINLNIGLFERVISMGIYPGEKIRITDKIPNGIIIEIKNKKFVLDNNIAKEIKVLEYEKS
jgi:Mn-dependent DtxR family transcriptional regulator